MAVRVKQKEAKTLRFTCRSNGTPVDLSSATLAFMVKAAKTDSDNQAKISKVDADFGKSQAVAGIITLPISASDLNQTAGLYLGELKITFAASAIDKSADISIIIEQAVIAA
jgi:hypothetical protein